MPLKRWANISREKQIQSPDGSQVKAFAIASRPPVVKGVPCPTMRLSKGRVRRSSILRRRRANHAVDPKIAALFHQTRRRMQSR